jgi:hypothetical protein
MVFLRLICGFLVAWAVNWVLAHSMAAALVEELPEMFYIGPAAGAVVGFFVVLGRRGSGLFIATLNGAWAGLLTIALSGVVYLAYKSFDAIIHNLLKNFEAYIRLIGQELKPFVEVGMDPKLIGITLGATAVVGFLSEVMYWARLRIRRYRGLPEEKKQVRAAVARGGAHI